MNPQQIEQALWDQQRLTGRTPDPIEVATEHGWTFRDCVPRQGDNLGEYRRRVFAMRQRCWGRFHVPPGGFISTPGGQTFHEGDEVPAELFDSHPHLTDWLVHRGMLLEIAQTDRRAFRDPRGARYVVCSHTSLSIPGVEGGVLAPGSAITPEDLASPGQPAIEPAEQYIDHKGLLHPGHAGRAAVPGVDGEAKIRELIDRGLVIDTQAEPEPPRAA